MSAFERIGRLLRFVLPETSGDDAERELMAAAVADLESQVAAALALYIEGDRAAVRELLGNPDTLGAAAAALPIICSFDSAAEALAAAVGDDGTRGYAALTTLRERAAEYAAAKQQLIARHTGTNPGN